ncbi:MAG: M28 family peptidase [Myxococcota bacterium]
MSYELLETLRADVEALTEPGERVVGSKGHRAARAWLLERMQRLGLQPYGDAFEWPYGPRNSGQVNVLGRLPGRDPSLPPMLLAAHYDTCGRQPGADDNAAAIAISLSSVKPLRSARLERDVVFAFFDGEEPPRFLTPNMGSTYFYRAQRKGPVHCAIVLDLCGHEVPIPGCGDLLFVTGMESDPGLEPVIEAGAEVRGVRAVPLLTRYIGDLSDYHAFRLDQRPYLFLTCARWEHYHMPTDTPDRLDYDKMAAIRNYVVAATQRASAQALSGPFEGYDTTPTEVAMVRRNMAPMLQQFGLEVQGREDIDQMVSMAMRLFEV